MNQNVTDLMSANSPAPASHIHEFTVIVNILKRRGVRTRDYGQPPNVVPSIANSLLQHRYGWRRINK